MKGLYIIFILLVVFLVSFCKSSPQLTNKTPISSINSTTLKTTNHNINATTITSNSNTKHKDQTDKSLITKNATIDINNTQSKKSSLNASVVSINSTSTNISSIENSTKIADNKTKQVKILNNLHNNDKDINNQKQINKKEAVTTEFASKPKKILNSYTSNNGTTSKHIKQKKVLNSKEIINGTKQQKKTFKNTSANLKIVNKSLQNQKTKINKKVKYKSNTAHKSKNFDKTTNSHHKTKNLLKTKTKINRKSYIKKTQSDHNKVIGKAKITKKHNKSNNINNQQKTTNNKINNKLKQSIKKKRANISEEKNNSGLLAKSQTVKKITNNEYIIGPGDILDVEVWKEPQLSAKVPVRPDGKITLPLINDIQAAGRTPLELRAAIQKALSKYLENPVVSVSVVGVNKKFFILGKVNAPGEYPLNSPITVLQAIALAKGFADWADKEHIIILRQLHGKQIRLKFNYEDVAQGKHLEENIYLKPGDTIIVP